MSGKIYESVSAVMSEIGAISKSKTNSQQNFKYRGVDDVMNALQPLLTKNKLFIVPEILNHAREERQTKSGSNLIYSVCTIKYTFYAEDGSNISAIVIGEGMDSGDKATNKAMAIAFKYACFQVFCIPTEEMKDPDGESHETAAKTKPKTNAGQKTESEKKDVELLTVEQWAELVELLGGKSKLTEALIEIGYNTPDKIKAIPSADFNIVRNKLADLLAS